MVHSKLIQKKIVKKTEYHSKQLNQCHPHLLECNLAGSNDQHQHLGHQEGEEV